MSIIYPMVQKGGPEFQISDANFAALERAGEITLSAELRKRLNDIAPSWAVQLTGLQSPRPKQFRNRLGLIKDTLVKAYEALDLNRAGASIWERHLFNWAGNAKVEGATSFFEDTDELLTRMRRMIDLVASLEQAMEVASDPLMTSITLSLWLTSLSAQEEPQSLTGVNTKTQAGWPIHHFAGSCRRSTKCFPFHGSVGRVALMMRFETRSSLAAQVRPKGNLLV
jgi:hypothetical protein